MSSPETDTSELHAALTCQLEKMHVIYRHLRKIWGKVKSRHQPFFSNSDLEAFGIKVSALNLRAASSRFFRPLPILPWINWDTMEFSPWLEGHGNEVRRITDNYRRLWGKAFLGQEYNKKVMPWR